MNSSAFASASSSTGPDESLAFLAFGGKKTPSSVSQSAEEALHNVAALIEPLLVQAVSARSAEEFAASEAEVFPKYVSYLTAYGAIVRASLTLRAVKQVNYESLLDLEVLFRTSGMEAFGEQIKDQAVFTAWTLRQINELVSKMLSRNVDDPHMRAEDRELAYRFRLNALQSRFSLDCLLISMREKIVVFPEVLARISDGLRAAVNAYGYIRQGYALRQTEEAQLIAPIEWDEEDDVLLKTSEWPLEA